MSVSTKLTNLRPCKFFCEGRTCKFGENCRFLHDDSLRGIAIEKRKFASYQRGCSNSQRKWVAAKHDDNSLKPASLEEYRGYTGVIQDWALATGDSTSNRRGFSDATPHKNSVQTVQLMEMGDRKHVTGSQPSASLSQQKQENKVKTIISLKNDDCLEEGRTYDGQSYEDNIDSTNNVLLSIGAHSPYCDNSSREKISSDLIATQQKDNHQHQRDRKNQLTNGHLRQSRWPKRSEFRAQKFNSPTMLSGWGITQHEECLWTREALKTMKVISDNLPSVKGFNELQRPMTQVPDSTAQPAKKSTLKEFQLFIGLPIELRLVIWKLTLQNGVHASVEMKEVTVARLQLRDSSEMPTGNSPQSEGDYTFIRRYAQPALLHVCRETRELALEHYQLCFQSKIFFNYATDVIYLHTIQPDDIRRFVLTCASEGLQSIQRLALNLRDTHVDEFVPLIRKLTGLKHLIIQFSYDDSEEYRGSREMVIQTAHLIRLDLKAGSKYLQPRYRVPRVQVVPPEHVEFS